MDELKRVLDERSIESETLRPLYGAGDSAVYAVTRGGEDAIDAWRALRDAVAGRGWWPVVLGEEGRVARVGEDLEFNLEGTTPRALVEKGLALDPAAWLARHDPGVWPDESEWAAEVIATPNHTFTVASDILTRRPHGRVAIALVPAREPWEIPAYLGIGGWNECPNPEVHVALMRSWHERFGAEIVGYTGDVVEMRVARPAADRETAEALAREQYTYCSDVVDQGVGTMDALAETLLGATVWYFWWD